MAKRRCRKCKSEKVSAPRFGTFVGDPKTLRKTAVGRKILAEQEEATKTSQAEPDTDEA